jgi:hypothetical protein
MLIEDYNPSPAHTRDLIQQFVSSVSSFIKTPLQCQGSRSQTRLDYKGLLEDKDFTTPGSPNLNFRVSLTLMLLS